MDAINDVIRHNSWATALLIEHFPSLPPTPLRLPCGRAPEQRGLNRAEAEGLLAERIARRRAKDFAEADAIRERLRDGGWEVVDSADGSELQALKAPPSSAPAPAPRAVTLLTVVHGWRPDVERWLLSVFTHVKADFEALLPTNSPHARMAGWLQ